MRKQRSPVEVAAEVFAAFMHGPRTMRDLAEFVGIDPDRSYLLRKYVDEFRASGLLFVAGYTSDIRPLFALQPGVFAKQDATAPEGYRPRPGRLNKPSRLYEFRGEKKGCAELAALAGVSYNTVLMRLQRMNAETAVAMGASARGKDTRAS
jgi:hypothetical protein